MLSLTFRVHVDQKEDRVHLVIEALQAKLDNLVHLEHRV